MKCKYSKLTIILNHKHVEYITASQNLIIQQLDAQRQFKVLCVFGLNYY